MYLSIGVTGHRDLLDVEQPVLESRLRTFFDELETRYAGLKLQLISPLAEGGDQLAARIALEKGIHLVVVLPMAKEDYEQDFDGTESLAGFRELFAAADQVIQLPEASIDINPDQAEPISSRDRQYAQVGLFISNHCQILLALWDGKEINSVAGTAQVVHYHLTAVMEGIENQQSSAHLLADNENDLAYHIVCSRDRPDGSPAQGLEPQTCYWITSQFGRVSADEFPIEYALMLERLEEFESDRLRHGLEEVRSAGLLDEVPLDLDIPESVRYTEFLFEAADRLAVHFQLRVIRSLYVIHTLAILMGLVFIVYSEYALPQEVLWIFLALFFSGVVLHMTGNRRQWHRKYLDYRALAEALRVQFYWDLSGVVDSHSAGFAYENFLQKQDVELGWIRHVMRTASLQRARGVDSESAWVPWVINQWVGDENSNSGQLAYYSRKASQNSVKIRRTEFLGAACLWSGIGVAVVLALTSGLLSAQQQKVLFILMGLLPLIAGVRDAIAHKKAEKELIKQYRFMARIFSNASRLLGDSQNIEFQRRVLKALGEAALEEGAEWILMHRARPLEHQGLA